MNHVIAAALAGVCLVVAGCEPYETTASGATRPAVCSVIEARLEADLARTGTCETDADCTSIGGQLGGTQTCDCAPYVLDCGGYAIERNAPNLADAVATINAYANNHCAVATACDCGPNKPPECGMDHRCHAEGQSCSWAPPPDAGVPDDAFIPPDAPL